MLEMWAQTKQGPAFLAGDDAKWDGDTATKMLAKLTKSSAQPQSSFCQSGLWSIDFNCKIVNLEKHPVEMRTIDTKEVPFFLSLAFCLSLLFCDSRFSLQWFLSASHVSQFFNVFVKNTICKLGCRVHLK